MEQSREVHELLQRNIDLVTQLVLLSDDNKIMLDALTNIKQAGMRRERCQLFAKRASDALSEVVARHVKYGTVYETIE